PDELFLGFFDCCRFEGVVRSFETLNQGAKLESKEPVFRARAAEDLQERFGTDQHRFGLAVNRQNESSVTFFERVEYFGQISMEFTTSNEANARLRHQNPRGLDWP